MRRSIVAALLALLMAGCSSHRVQENLTPDFTFAFVVDGRVSKTLSVSARSEWVSAVVQPHSGESAMWQNHGATFANVVLEPTVEATTPTGGSTLEIDGEISYYRDLKFTHVNGNDEVVRGRPIKSEDVEPVTVTVEPGAPANVSLAEGVSVMITALPRQAPAPQP